MTQSNDTPRPDPLVALRRLIEVTETTCFQLRRLGREQSADYLAAEIAVARAALDSIEEVSREEQPDAEHRDVGHWDSTWSDAVGIVQSWHDCRAALAAASPSREGAGPGLQEALRDLRRYSEAHHGDQDKNVLLHSLLVDIPDRLDALIDRAVHGSVLRPDPRCRLHGQPREGEWSCSCDEETEFESAEEHIVRMAARLTSEEQRETP